MTTTPAARKSTQKLQRAVVDGLEAVKAQDIRVFDTEALSALFERVIVASGTSNRQTRALSQSVLDAVRKAGFAKPRVEGENNGEWIIVDCGSVVVHIMQPSFRQYYHLEELWGGKPVRLKLGAPAVAKPAAALAVASPARKTSRKTAAAVAVVAEPAPAPAPTPATAARRRAPRPAATAGAAARDQTAASAPSEATAAKATARRAPRRKAATPAAAPVAPEA